ncbi:hypothetical protein R3P38DRAFT_3190194 [Favolaschia claudopus]|uniref:Uncharacterized protein n=1 Tax=Favolaschia claudopus TaxID=2862362 RepID=A0AAW0BPY2_9AGAR
MSSLSRQATAVGHMTKSHTPLTPPTRLRTRLPLRIASEKYVKVSAITAHPSRRWGAQRLSKTCSASLLLVCAAADFDEEDILQVASIKRPKPATPGRC